jgi:hypothetical protein
MSEQGAGEQTEVDYFELGQSIKASHIESKESQRKASSRKRAVPYLFATGLVTLLTGLAARREEPIAVGAVTEAIGLAIYGQARRQGRTQGIIAVGAALYQLQLSEVTNKGVPTWATQEMAEASPNLIHIAREIITEEVDGGQSTESMMSEWAGPVPE